MTPPKLLSDAELKEIQQFCDDDPQRAGYFDNTYPGMVRCLLADRAALTAVPMEGDETIEDWKRRAELMFDSNQSLAVALAKANGELNDARAALESLTGIARDVVAWEERWPINRFYDEFTTRTIAAEMTAIVEHSRAALHPNSEGQNR